MDDHSTFPPTTSRIERRRARTRQRLLTLVIAPVALAVLAVGTMGAAPSSGAQPFSANADDTIADLQSYWSTTMPQVYGTAYQPIPASRLFPYSQSNPPPGCGTRGTTPYAEVAGNAFYCSQGDFVAWDTQQLFPKLTSQFGAFAPALVLAHEWGHAIQARVGFETYQTVYMEQQADCFAGAWAGHVASGDAGLSISADDLDRALAGMLQLSDPVGIDSSQDGAHGNGFDRVGAFQDGVEGGAAACADYANNPPAVTESGFSSQADYASGGDMSLDTLVPTIEKALDSYWSNAVGSKFAAPKLVAAIERCVVRRRVRRRGARRHGRVLRGLEHRAVRAGNAARRVLVGRGLRGRAPGGDRLVVGGAARPGQVDRRQCRVAFLGVPGRSVHRERRRLELPEWCEQRLAVTR